MCHLVHEEEVEKRKLTLSREQYILSRLNNSWVRIRDRSNAAIYALKIVMWRGPLPAGCGISPWIFHCPFESWPRRQIVSWP